MELWIKSAQLENTEMYSSSLIAAVADADILNLMLYVLSKDSGGTAWSIKIISSKQRNLNDKFWGDTRGFILASYMLGDLGFSPHRQTCIE